MVSLLAESRVRDMHHVFYLPSFLLCAGFSWLPFIDSTNQLTEITSGPSRGDEKERVLGKLENCEGPKQSVRTISNTGGFSWNPDDGIHDVGGAFAEPYYIRCVASEQESLHHSGASKSLSRCILQPTYTESKSHPIILGNKNKYQSHRNHS